MQVCGQTLILVDNDATVSEVNQKIINSTLKYMFYHAPENRAFSLNTYTHELEGDEVYETDVNELLCKLDLMEYAAKDSNLTDVIAGVLTNWKKSDFACRDIIVFTDGLEGINTLYEDDELYYLINNTNYPIYIVDLVQEGNQGAKKHLSAIATMSEGELYLSEYPGDDAGVDKHLTEEIFARMDAYAIREWGIYEEGGQPISEKNSGEISEENHETTQMHGNSEDIPGEAEYLEKAQGSYELEKDIVGDEYLILEESDKDIIYSETKTEDFFGMSTFIVSMLIVFSVIIVSLLTGLYVVKKKRKEVKEEEEVRTIVRHNTIPGVMFEEEDPNATLVLTEGEESLNDDEENDRTRLLVPVAPHRIEIDDSLGVMESKTVCFGESFTAGRKAELNEVVIDDDSVSKRHCRFYYTGGKFYVKDLESANGTYVNDEKTEESVIKTGDRIKIGRGEYVVKCYE